MAVLSTDGKIISGDVVNFLSSDESSYPQLTRLYLEYDFRVIEITKIGDEAQPKRPFTLSYKSRTSERAVTPTFDSLEELEHHTQENVLAILQETVFQTTFISVD